jgi:hypothetical protein
MDRNLNYFLRLTRTWQRNVAMDKDNASWSNRSTVTTYEHVDSTSFSTHLQLMGGDAELGEFSNYYSGNPGLMEPEDPGVKAASPEMPAPDISVSVMPYGAPPAPDTSEASITASHRRMTGVSKVRLLSSGYEILYKSGSKNAGSSDDIHWKLAPHAYLEHAGRKDHGQALLDRASTPLMSDDEDPIVADITTTVVNKGEGTYRTLSE